MRTSKGNIHLEIQTSRKSPVGLLRTTYWDKKARTYRHTQQGRITGCRLEQPKAISPRILHHSHAKPDIGILNRKNSRRAQCFRVSCQKWMILVDFSSRLRCHRSSTQRQ